MKTILPLFLLMLFLLDCQQHPQTVPQPANPYFTFSDSVTVPGKPVAIYDAATGDVSPWWDHSFSEHPYKVYIEAKPGGGFYELFDDSGNGVLHATVIVADRGKLLRFNGPLGLSGQAINLVCTYEFFAAGSDSTKLRLSVHGSGEFTSGTPEIVQRVWRHFLAERFKPYLEGRLN